MQSPNPQEDLSSEEYQRVLYSCASDCRDQALRTRIAVTTLERIVEQVKLATKNVGSVGEYWGLMELEQLVESINQYDQEIGSWLRHQGVVALISSLEVFLQELLLDSLRYNRRLFKSFLKDLSSTSRWKGWRLALEDLGELVYTNEPEEWILRKLFERMIFHKFEWVDDLYLTAYGFELFDGVEKDVKTRIFAYREIRHEILHGITGGNSWVYIDMDPTLDLAFNDIVTFSLTVFENVIESLEKRGLMPDE